MMSKSILIIDKPKSCNRCRLQAYDNDGGMICAGEYLTAFEPKNTSIHDNYWNGTKPNWCPLKLLPKYINEEKALDITKVNDHTYLNGVVDGFSICLNEISGE